MASRVAATKRRISAASMLRRRAIAVANPAAAGPGWAALSDYYSRLASDRDDRDDLNVVVAPRITATTAQERSGEKPCPPGYYLSMAARVALDGELLPAAPDKLDTSDPDHFQALACLHGVYEHEIGHALHTDSVQDAFRDRILSGAVRILEEIRMEARRIEDRAFAAKWLRVAALRLILAEAPTPETVAQAAHQAILTEGRVAAGSLKIEDVELISDALEDIFDPDELGELRSIMADTVAVEDGDNEALLAAAQRLVDLMPEEPGGRGGESLDGAAASALASAMAEALGDASKDASEDLEADPTAGGELDEMVSDAEEAEQEAAAQDGGDSPDGETVAESPVRPVTGGASRVSSASSGTRLSWKIRPPTTDERRTRNRLREKLRTARWRERVTIKIASLIPPGRLRQREAVRAAAERSMGRPTSARPFRRKRRRHAEMPTVRVGLAVDVHSSMGKAGCTAGTVWALAAALQDVDSMVAVTAFGDEVRDVIPAGRRVGGVPDYECASSAKRVAEAVLRLDEQLNWAASEAPGLLVVVTDGCWGDHERNLLEPELERLHALGVHTICLGTGDTPWGRPCNACAPKSPGFEHSTPVCSHEELVDVVAPVMIDMLAEA